MLNLANILHRQIKQFDFVSVYLGKLLNDNVILNVLIGIINWIPTKCMTFMVEQMYIDISSIFTTNRQTLETNASRWYNDWKTSEVV